MNQAASAARRAPADSTTSAGGCCPMVNAPFFGLPTPAAAPQCFLSPQAQQLVQLARRQQQQQQQQQQSSVVISPQQHTVSQQQPTQVAQQQQQQQQQPQLQPQPQQPTTQRSHDQTSNHYSTSLAASNLSLQHSIANHHSAANCAALAAALAVSIPQFQQQLLLTQNHQATPTNQPTQTVAPSTIMTQPNASTTFTSQVPTLNYNSYSSSQPYINLATHTVPQSAPPVAVHQQQTNTIPSNILSTNLNTIVPNAPLSNGANNLHQNVQQLGPLVNNTALNSSAGQLANSIYRSSQQQPTDQPPNVHQQQPQQQPTSTPTPAQQLGQTARNILNEEPFSLQLLNHQVQLLEQFFSNQQFAQPLSAFQLPPQPLSAPQQIVNAPRTQTTLPLSGQSPAVMTHAQQVTSTQIAPPQQHRPSEQASENQQQGFQHTNIQSRSNQAPQQQTTSPNDSYQPSSVNTTASGSYQSQSNNDLHIHSSLPEPVSQAHQGAQTLPPQPSQVPVNPQNHQHPPSQTNMGLPIYPYQQDRAMQQMMALMINPAVANNLLNILSYISNNHRMESHHTHHHPAHHFHQHLHSTHHHHHGQNGQANGQDASMPLDSMAINESKPRGLTRAEIDSLTPYMHTNEKDTRSCVICLSKFELKSKIRPLPCNHAFHAKCVDKWLRTNRTCPICRRDALKTFNGKIKRI